MTDRTHSASKSESRGVGGSGTPPVRGDRATQAYADRTKRDEARASYANLEREWNATQDALFSMKAERDAARARLDEMGRALYAWREDACQAYDALIEIVMERMDSEVQKAAADQRHVPETLREPLQGDYRPDAATPPCAGCGHPRSYHAVYGGASECYWQYRQLCPCRGYREEKTCDDSPAGGEPATGPDDSPTTLANASIVGSTSPTDLDLAAERKKVARWDGVSYHDTAMGYLDAYEQMRDERDRALEDHRAYQVERDTWRNQAVTAIEAFDRLVKMLPEYRDLYDCRVSQYPLDHPGTCPVCDSDEHGKSACPRVTALREGDE